MTSIWGTRKLIRKLTQESRLTRLKVVPLMTRCCWLGASLHSAPVSSSCRGPSRMNKAGSWRTAHCLFVMVTQTSMRGITCVGTHASERENTCTDRTDTWLCANICTHPLANKEVECDPGGFACLQSFIIIIIIIIRPHVLERWLRCFSTVSVPAYGGEETSQLEAEYFSLWQDWDKENSSGAVGQTWDKI